MSLIVVSDPLCFKNEASLINQLFEAGMAIFHLRKPELDKKSYANLISQIAPQYYERIALHQFHDLVKDFPLIKRLHYPEKLRKEETEYDQTYVLSTSIHNLNDLHQLKHFDYTFYGPVFNSISKPGYSGLDDAELKLPVGIKHIKMIALGGIDVDNMKNIKQIGFDGAAVLGAIWEDKTQAVIKFKSLINSYHKSF